MENSCGTKHIRLSVVVEAGDEFVHSFVCVFVCVEGVITVGWLLALIFHSFYRDDAVYSSGVSVRVSGRLHSSHWSSSFHHFIIDKRHEKNTISFFDKKIGSDN